MTEAQNSPDFDSEVAGKQVTVGDVVTALINRSNALAVIGHQAEALNARQDAEQIWRYYGGQRSRPGCRWPVTLDAMCGDMTDDRKVVLCGGCE